MKLEDMTEPELRAFMVKLAVTVKATAEKAGLDDPQFVLILFNDPKVGQYISNCDRRTMIDALKETAERLEKNEDIPR